MTHVIHSDGRVLVVGGVRALVEAPPAKLLDPLRGRSAGTSSPPLRSRVYATATQLRDGRVLIVGGSSPASAPSAELYDAARDQFTFTAQAPAVTKPMYCGWRSSR